MSSSQAKTLCEPKMRSEVSPQIQYEISSIQIPERPHERKFKRKMSEEGERARPKSTQSPRATQSSDRERGGDSMQTKDPLDPGAH